MKLNARQERFIDQFMLDLNATQAAIRAGYSKRTAYSQAHDLLKKPEIQAELAKRRNQLIERTHIDQDRVIAELAALGFSNVQDFLDPDTGSPLALHQVPRSAAAALQQYEVTETLDENGNVIRRTTRVKLANKEVALERLGRHLGMFDGRTVEPPQGSGRDHEDPTVSPVRRLTMLVMAAMREAKERGIVADVEVDDAA